MNERSRPPKAVHSKSLFHLFCFFLFGAGYVEPYIPNGTTYVAGVTGVVALLCGTMHFLQRKKKSSLSIVDVVFALYIGYTLIHVHGTFELGYGIKAIAMASVWWYTRQLPKISESIIAVWAVISGALQSIIGALQLCGVLVSNHAVFPATGTFNNPGIWGGYLAVTLALSLPSVLEMTGKGKYFMGTGCTLIVVGLALSNSRAAWLSVIVVSFILLLQHQTRTIRKYIIASALIMTPLFGWGLYLLRPASADARGLIWQIGAKMYAQSPTWGGGTGSFAANYMTMQAKVLRTAPIEVQRMADDNLLAFNEVLLVLCEQGIVGLLFLGTVSFFLLNAFFKSPLKTQQAQKLSLLIALFIFSLFSYPSSIWALLVFFPFVAASISTPSITNVHFYRLSIGAASVGYCLLSMGLFSIFQAHIRINQYADLQSDVPVSPSIIQTTRHDAFLTTLISEAAWLIGDNKTLLQYAPILESFKQTAQWKVRLGECYELIGKTQKALFYYRAAHHMVPGLTSPLFAEFSLWRNLGKHQQARHAAWRVIHHNPKIKNNSYNQMKHEAHIYIMSNH